MPDHSQTDAASLVDEVVEKYSDELVDLRRDLHTHPELSWAESRTTERVVEHLDGTGWIAGPARRRRAWSRDIGEGGRTGGAAGRPRRAAGRRPHQRPLEQHRPRRRARLRPRRAHQRRWSAPASRSPPCTSTDCCPAACGCSSSPPRRSCPAGRCRCMPGRRPRRRPARLRAALRPQPRRGPRRPARGADHRRRRHASASGSPARAATPAARTSPRTSPSRSAS